MSKAEEKSRNRYPTMAEKYAFIDGYEQAEKDNELTWEDIETIQEMANKYCKHHSCEPRFFVYSEVLKRFKNFKERKEKWYQTTLNQEST